MTLRLKLFLILCLLCFSGVNAQVELAKTEKVMAVLEKSIWGKYTVYLNRTFKDSTPVKYALEWYVPRFKGQFLKAIGDSTFLLKGENDSVKVYHVDSILYLKTNISERREKMWALVGVGVVINYAGLKWARDAFALSTNIVSDIFIVFGTMMIMGVGIGVATIGTQVFNQYGKKDSRYLLRIYNVPKEYLEKKRLLNRYIGKQVKIENLKIKAEKRAKRVMKRRARDGYEYKPKEKG